MTRGNHVKICQLEEFVTLAEKLNFSEAAKAHFVSRSALSKHITALENALGEILFSRDSKSLELTDAGRAFYEGIQPILEEYEHFVAEYKQARRGAGKRLQVSLSIRPPYLVNALSELSAPGALPFGVSYVSSVDMPYGRFLESTQDSIAIMYDSAKVDRGQFSVEKIAEVPLVAIVPSTHPLADRDRISFCRDLQGQTLVKLRSRFFSHGWDAIETLLDRHGVQARSSSSFVASSFELAILNGLRDILLIPESPTAPLAFLENGRHKALQFQERVCFDVIVAWNERTTDAECAREYAKRLRKAISATTPAYAAARALR